MPHTSLNKGSLSSASFPHKGNDGPGIWCELPSMGKFSNHLKELRKLKGWTQDMAADAMGLSRGGYLKLEYGDNQLTSQTISTAARVFGVPRSVVLSGPETVRIVGLAGAGPDGAVSFDTEVELGDAPMPPGGGPSTVALEVRGDSMRGIAEDGWLVYYDDRKQPVTEDLYGELCVVGLADGRTLVKKIVPGRDGAVHLVSSNAEPMLDQVVDWAAAVTAIVPRRTALKMSKRT